MYFKSLNLEKIESSPQIQEWLEQFSQENKLVAKSILCQLRFVSRDVFSKWFFEILSKLDTDKKAALIAVRKIENKRRNFFEDSGDTVSRSGSSLGSEDLVYSLISNASRSSEVLFDHPSLECIKKNKIRNFLLIDDSIGSGNRVHEFVTSMLKNKTFRSWWSYGLVHVTIASFTRLSKAEATIIEKIPGSNSPRRKFPISDKLTFVSAVVYSKDSPKGRWGDGYESYLKLCSQEERVSIYYRLGFMNTMANVVFYHSVPDTVPGMFWATDGSWRGLFDGRVMASWITDLLENSNQIADRLHRLLPPEMLELLALLKRGIRRTSTIAQRLNCEPRTATSLISRCQKLTLITPKLRLTESGIRQLKMSPASPSPSWDLTLYTPTSWCAGQVSVQPPGSDKLCFTNRADSVCAAAPADGDSE